MFSGYIFFIGTECQDISKKASSTDWKKYENISIYFVMQLFFLPMLLLKYVGISGTFWLVFCIVIIWVCVCMSAWIIFAAISVVANLKILGYATGNEALGFETLPSGGATCVTVGKSSKYFTLVSRTFFSLILVTFFPRLLLENAIIKRDFGIQLEGQIVTRSSVYALRCLYVCVSVFMCAPRNLSRGGERVSTSSRRPGVSAHDSECSLDNLWGGGQISEPWLR